MVTWVGVNSPADGAHVEVGDQITTLDGQGYRELSLKEVVALFFRSEAGDRLKLTLVNRIAKTPRDVTLQLTTQDASHL